MLKGLLTAASIAVLTLGTPAFAGGAPAEKEPTITCTASDLELLESKTESMTDQDTRTSVMKDVTLGKQALAAKDMAGCAKAVQSANATLKKAAAK